MGTQGDRPCDFIRHCHLSPSGHVGDPTPITQQTMSIYSWVSAAAHARQHASFVFVQGRLVLLSAPLFFPPRLINAGKSCEKAKNANSAKSADQRRVAAHALQETRLQAMIPTRCQVPAASCQVPHTARRRAESASAVHPDPRMYSARHLAHSV